jgi:hypothetical protein
LHVAYVDVLEHVCVLLRWWLRYCVSD